MTLVRADSFDAFLAGFIAAGQPGITVGGPPPPDGRAAKRNRKTTIGKEIA